MDIDKKTKKNKKNKNKKKINKFKFVTYFKFNKIISFYKKINTLYLFFFFRNQLMLSEKLEEIPEDFETNWIAVKVPDGIPCLVISYNGK